MTKPPHSCGKCPARWHGVKFAHCRACHRTFTTPQNFDLHRVGDLDSRRCDVEVTNSKTGVRKLAELRPGVWGAPADESGSDFYCSPRKDHRG